MINPFMPKEKNVAPVASLRTVWFPLHAEEPRSSAGKPGERIRLSGEEPEEPRTRTYF